MQSLATGRLATYSLPFVDCELPFDPDQIVANDGSTQPSCKSSFILKLPVIESVSQSHTGRLALVLSVSQLSSKAH